MHLRTHGPPFKSAAGCFLLIAALFVSQEALPGTLWVEVSEKIVCIPPLPTGELQHSVDVSFYGNNTRGDASCKTDMSSGEHKTTVWHESRTLQCSWILDTQQAYTYLHIPYAGTLQLGANTSCFFMEMHRSIYISDALCWKSDFKNASSVQLLLSLMNYRIIIVDFCSGQWS